MFSVCDMCHYWLSYLMLNNALYNYVLFNPFTAIEFKINKHLSSKHLWKKRKQYVPQYIRLLLEHKYMLLFHISIVTFLAASAFLSYIYLTYMSKFSLNHQITFFFPSSLPWKIFQLKAVWIIGNEHDTRLQSIIIILFNLHFFIVSTKLLSQFSALWYAYFLS